MVQCLTVLLGAPVAATGLEPVGRLDDLVADARGGDPPCVTRLVVRTHRGSRESLGVDALRRFDAAGIEVDEAAGWLPLVPTHQVQLRRQLLDHQVIDLPAGVVRRVNDVVLTSTPEGLVVSGVDVGLVGLARELAPRARRDRLGRTHPGSPWQRVLRWADINPVESAINRYQVADPHARVRRLTPKAIVRVLRRLRRSDRLAILAALDEATVLAVLETADPRFRRVLAALLDRSTTNGEPRR
jgi:hypothetical protein